MNKAQKEILMFVNDSLDEAGLPQMQPHKFFPMTENFEIDFGDKVLVLQPSLRRLGLFVRDGSGGWGQTTLIGEYHGRGWRKRLVRAVVEAVAVTVHGSVEKWLAEAVK